MAAPTIRVLLMGSLVLIVAWPAGAASCYWEPVQEVILVCGHYSDGTTSCHYQYEWSYEYVCEGAGGGGSYPPPPPGGGGYEPPPNVDINSISDYNPEQPVLYISVTNAVDCTLSYDGYTTMTFSPTDHVFLEPLPAMGERTTVTIQCRNNSNVYAAALMEVTRESHLAEGLIGVYATWTVLQPLQQDPVIYHGDWNRGIDLTYKETSYSVPTVNARNGLYEHISVKDQLGATKALLDDQAPVIPQPIPAWETRYRIENPALINVHYGTNCDLPPIVFGYSFTSMCTNVNAFVREGSPGGIAEIVALDVPGAMTTLIWSGKTLDVSP